MKTILIFLILLFNISLNAQYYKIYKHLKDSTYKIDSTKKDSVKIIVNNYNYRFSRADDSRNL